MKYAIAFCLSALAVSGAVFATYASTHTDTCRSSITMSGGVVIEKQRTCI